MWRWVRGRCRKDRVGLKMCRCVKRETMLFLDGLAS